MYKRIMVLELPPGQSAFLLGGRNTGKSTYLPECFPDAQYYDLLKSDTYTRLLNKPHKIIARF